MYLQKSKLTELCEPNAQVHTSVPIQSAEWNPQYSHSAVKLVLVNDYTTQ